MINYYVIQDYDKYMTVYLGSKRFLYTEMWNIDKTTQIQCVKLCLLHVFN